MLEVPFAGKKLSVEDEDEEPCSVSVDEEEPCSASVDDEEPCPVSVEAADDMVPAGVKDELVSSCVLLAATLDSADSVADPVCGIEETLEVFHPAEPDISVAEEENEAEEVPV